MNTIEIIPAIDIRHGKCVRLYQGDYDRETVFNDNPLDVALRWQSLVLRVYILLTWTAPPPVMW